jgi:hypothetical protein
LNDLSVKLGCGDFAAAMQQAAYALPTRVFSAISRIFIARLIRAAVAMFC